MINKLLEAMYHQVFINIIVERATTTVYVEYCAKGKTLHSFEQKFETITCNKRLCDFIELHKNDSPFHYVSLLDTSTEQGAVPTCKEAEASKYANISLAKLICHKGGWGFYTSKADLDLIQMQYKDIGIDLIFSPFVMLYRIFKEKIDATHAMFILLEDNFLTLSVFDNGELLYAEHIDMEHSSEADELSMASDEIDLDFDLDSSIDLDDVDALEDFDDFSDIEDLDTLEEIDEFADADDFEIKNNHSEGKQDLESDHEQGFNEDYQRYLLIKSSLGNFYKDERYKSEFVENVYIADGVKVSSDLKRYLEDEMFVTVYMRSVDLSLELCEMAKDEVR